MPRTNEQITERLDALLNNDDISADFFGKRAEILALALPFDAAKKYLTAAAIEEGDEPWDSERGTPEKNAAEYLEFAIEKMQTERGLSSNRSVDAYREYLWLLTDDKTLADYEATEYGWYGDAKLRFAAKALGLTEIWNRLTHENVPA